MSDFTTSISIGQPSVFNHKYVIAFTVHIHATTSAGSVWQMLRALQLASLPNSNSKSATASLTVKVTHHWLPTSHLSSSKPYLSSINNWLGRSPAGSYSSGQTHRMVGLVPASVGTKLGRCLSLQSWPNTCD